VDETDQILRARQQGKVVLFLFVGAVSGLLLLVSVHYFQEDQWLPGILSLAGSTAFWYPLFRLGMLHARKRPPG
jgi:CHASE2 domain-containing sensor protein